MNIILIRLWEAKKINVYLKDYIYFDFLFLSLTHVREKKREKFNRDPVLCIYYVILNARRKHMTKAFPFVRDLK